MSSVPDTKSNSLLINKTTFELISEGKEKGACKNKRYKGIMNDGVADLAFPVLVAIASTLFYITLGSEGSAVALLSTEQFR